jgi:hypothetical protein
VSGREEQNIATITMAGHESHGGHPATSMTQDSSDSPTLLLKMELVEAIQTGADAFERFCTLLNRLLSLSRSVAMCGQRVRPPREQSEHRGLLDGQLERHGTASDRAEHLGPL